MSEFEELKTIIRGLLTERFAPKPSFVRGLMGDGLGNVTVPDKPDHVYARFGRGSTEFFEVFNKTISPIDGWPILIGELPWQPGLTQVVDTDWSAYEQSGWGAEAGMTSAHAPTHEWPDSSPGSDPMNVYMRAIVPLRGYVVGSGSTTFYANSYTYEYQGTGTTWTGLPGLDTSAPMAALTTGQAQMLAVYLNPPTNTLAALTGTIDVFTNAFDPPRPAFPSAVLPVAWVRLYGSQAGLTEADIRDARRPFALPFNNSQSRLRIVKPTDDYTVLANDDLILASATGTSTISLPTAAGREGKRYYIKKIDATVNAVTLDGFGTETIDELATQDIDAQYDALNIVSDGSNWWIVST